MNNPAKKPVTPKSTSDIGFKLLVASAVGLGALYVGLNKTITKGPVSDFFDSFSRVAVPEPYCVLKTSPAGAHVEIHARTSQNQGNRVLYQTSGQLFSTDGKLTPLKEGMTGIYKTASTNTVHIPPNSLHGAPNITRISAPYEYTTLTLDGWQLPNGSRGPMGHCTITSQLKTVGPVWDHIPLRLK